jgi:CheY-like chemotaxis protein
VARGRRDRLRSRQMVDTQNPVVIAFGKFRSDERSRLSAIAEQARIDVPFGENSTDLEELLNRGPKAVVVHAATPDLAEVCQVVRTHPEGGAIPVIAVTEDLEDAAFHKVLTAGGDDLVQLTGARLLVRLRSVCISLRPPPPEPRGLALVADRDESRRRRHARILEQAGFIVEFGTSVEDVRRRMESSSSPRVLVLEAGLEGGKAALKKSAQTHAAAAHVLLSPLERAATDAEELEQHLNAAVIVDDAPAESVVFLINELSKPGASNRRRTRRVPYGTLVAFRGEERNHGDYGFAHNLSAGGLYVRTLAPPEEDTVWVQLRPPRAARWVHLEGRVVWRRPHGPVGTATVPPGFGVQLTDATSRSMEGWLDGYIGLVDLLHSPVRFPRKENDGPAEAVP